MSDKNWKDNDIQFPRLLAEINAIGLTDKQYLDLGSLMDLARWEIDELFDRAETEWRKHKAGFDVDLPSLPKKRKPHGTGTTRKPRR